MGQRHKYEYEVDPDSDSASARVARMVGNGKRVLDIGAGPGSITRVLRERGNCRVTAIEVDAEAIQRLSPYCERVLRCDLNDAGWTAAVAADGKFQVIVAADVLEHLHDPWKTLAAMKDVLSADGYAVVSLPHIGHNTVVACLVEEDLSYQDWGLLDRTHLRFFGILNMQRLFEDAGFRIVDAEFVVRSPNQTEFADRWARAPRALKRALARNRFGLVYQVVVKAKPGSPRDGGIRLADLPVVPYRRPFPPGTPLGTRLMARAKSAVSPRVNPRTRARLRNWLDRIGVKY